MPSSLKNLSVDIVSSFILYLLSFVFYLSSLTIALSVGW